MGLKGEQTTRGVGVNVSGKGLSGWSGRLSSSSVVQPPSAGIYLARDDADRRADKE
jgi:hypothetical protein